MIVIQMIVLLNVEMEYWLAKNNVKIVTVLLMMVVMNVIINVIRIALIAKKGFVLSAN